MTGEVILEKTKKKNLIFNFIVREGPVISKKVHTFAKEHMRERNVYSILKKLVEDGVIIKVPNFQLMTTSIYSHVKISHQMEEETAVEEGI